MIHVAEGPFHVDQCFFTAIHGVEWGLNGVKTGLNGVLWCLMVLSCRFNGFEENHNIILLATCSHYPPVVLK